MFLYSGGNRPESKVTRMFRQIRQVAAPGAKRAVSDCILLRYVIGFKGSLFIAI